MKNKVKGLPIMARMLGIVLFLIFHVNAFDLIIDKDGNELVCKIISINQNSVTYKPDTLASEVKTISTNRVFMIKYNNGEKVLFKDNHDPNSEGIKLSERHSLSLLTNIGLFGLFNINNSFTKASYSVGFTPLYEYRLNNALTIGSECMILFGKPETKDPLRLIIDPNIRFKASLSLTQNIFLEPIVSVGLSFWPQTSEIAYIDSTFTSYRFGWQARAAIGIDYKVTRKFSIYSEVGYSANSSNNRNVWITHDMMLIGVGPKLYF